jgi:uncharacterized membrane protein YdjX (TVP38/TMEM64 family)
MTTATLNQPRRTWVRVLVGAGILAALIGLGTTVGGRIPELSGWVARQGVWGGVAFIAGYAIATVAFVPGSVLTLVAGVIFGVLHGTAYVFMGAVLGSTAAFLIARHVARPLVERRLKGTPRFARLDRAVAKSGRRIVLLLRLSPVLPFNLLNYALGLTRVRLADYVLASVAMLPGTLLYVYSGSLIGDVAAVAGGADVERNTAYWIFLVVGLGATLAVTVVVTRIARRALNEEEVIGAEDGQ